MNTNGHHILSTISRKIQQRYFLQSYYKKKIYKIFTKSKMQKNILPKKACRKPVYKLFFPTFIEHKNIQILRD